MSLRMQALLLRFLENGEVQTIGADYLNSVADVRVIAATHRDLAQRVREGEFREDLFYRLRVVHLRVPPLRERLEDIPALVHHFVGHLQASVAFTDAALALMRRYHWPGNVRELQNVVEQAVWLCETDVITTEHIETCLDQTTPAPPVAARQIADELFEAIAARGYSFWEHVHPMFLSRDLTRHDIRELVHRGLAITGGNYRALLRLFNIPDEDYKRFLNFLAAHDCSIDVRVHRGASGYVSRQRTLELPPLRPQAGKAEDVIGSDASEDRIPTPV